ncbi:hypothetical protein H4R34_006439, partial [Dimargaris verticillata]
SLAATDINTYYGLRTAFGLLTDKLPTSSGLIAQDDILGQHNRAYVLDHKRRRHIVTYPTLDE